MKSKYLSDYSKSQYVKRIDWHPALCAAFQLELREYIPDKVKLICNHPVTRKPFKFNALVIELGNEAKVQKSYVEKYKTNIEILVIKVKKGVEIKKSFARNFKKHNIVEYRSSDVPISVFDYHKLQGDGLLYSSFDKKDNIDIRDVSATLIFAKLPQNVLDDVHSRFGITLESPGIYSVNKGAVQSQIIAINELPEDDNFWITSLRNDLNADQLKRIHVDTAPYKNDPLISKYLDIIIKANFETHQ